MKTSVSVSSVLFRAKFASCAFLRLISEDARNKGKLTC